MKDNVVKNKSFAFAVRIVKLYQYLCENKKEFVLSKQLLRSGTSVGAMIREAEHAEMILNIKWQLLKKKSTKLFTGLNY
jgi:four helix bundle protein